MFQKPYLRNNPVKDTQESKWPSRSCNQWLQFFRTLKASEVKWLAPWMTPCDAIYRCGNKLWVPLPGIWGTVGHAPLLATRQWGERQDIPMTSDLSSWDHRYTGSTWSTQAQEATAAWGNVYIIKHAQIDHSATPDYLLWHRARAKNIKPMSAGPGRPTDSSEVQVVKQVAAEEEARMTQEIQRLQELLKREQGRRGDADLEVARLQNELTKERQSRRLEEETAKQVCKSLHAIEVKYQNLSDGMKHHNETLKNLQEVRQKGKNLEKELVKCKVKKRKAEAEVEEKILKIQRMEEESALGQRHQKKYYEEMCLEKSKLKSQHLALQIENVKLQEESGTMAEETHLLRSLLAKTKQEKLRVYFKWAIEKEKGKRRSPPPRSTDEENQSCTSHPSP